MAPMIKKKAKKVMPLKSFIPSMFFTQLVVCNCENYKYKVIKKIQNYHAKKKRKILPRKDNKLSLHFSKRPLALGQRNVLLMTGI